MNKTKTYKVYKVDNSALADFTVTIVNNSALADFKAKFVNNSALADFKVYVGTFGSKKMYISNY